MFFSRMALAKLSLGWLGLILYLQKQDMFISPKIMQIIPQTIWLLFSVVEVSSFKSATYIAKLC